MPKIKKKKGNEENMKVKMNSIEKYFKPTEKFDLKRILRERQGDVQYWEISAKLDKEINTLNVLCKEKVKKIEEVQNPTVPPKLGFLIFDRSKFNMLFQIKNDHGVINSNLQQFIAMSVVKDDVQANIYFRNLLMSNWFPVLDDVVNVLINWGGDVVTFTKKPLLKCVVNDDEKIGRDNFELVMKFLTYSIQKNSNGYVECDLITLTKFAVALYFDHQCRQMSNAIKKLFSTCVKTAFCHGDDTSIIMFAQELYSSNEQEDLFKMVVDLFLPIENNVVKKVHTYITYKLFKSLLEKTNNINSFPSSINDWFVQDLVDRNYFNQKQKNVSDNLIQLLEHVVSVFNLYDNEQKLSDMAEFLHSIIRSNGVLESHRLINILDQWRLRLFRLHTNRKHILDSLCSY